MNEQEIKQDSQEIIQEAIEAKTEALHDLSPGDNETEAIKGGPFDVFMYATDPRPRTR